MPREKRAPSAPSGGQRRVGRSRSVAPVPAPAAIQGEGGSSANVHTAARSTPSSSVASQVTPAASHPVVSAVGPSDPLTNQVAPVQLIQETAAGCTNWGGESVHAASTGLAPPNLGLANRLSAQSSMQISAGRVAGITIPLAIQAPTFDSLALPVGQAVDMLPHAVGMGAARPSTLYSLGNDATIDMHVPQGIKEKIWNGQYVDLAGLYRDTAARVLTSRKPGSELTMAVEQGKVIFRPATPHTRKLNSIDKWTSA